MATGIFKGPKGALIFMGSVCFSVLMLIGSEDDEGALVMATDEIARETAAPNEFGPPPPRQDAMPPQPQQQARPQPQYYDEVEFADDSELIDDTAGFDPTPDIEEPFDTLPE